MQRSYAPRLWEQLDLRLDRFAIGVSGLCVAHCIATTVFLAVGSVAGALMHPLIHEVGLLLAIALGVFALGRGIVKHGEMLPSAVGGFGLGMMGGALALPHGGQEIIWTLVGVSLLALGHELNRRAAG